MAAASSSENKRTARAFVRNLPPSTTSETLLAHFSFYNSDIIDAKVFRDPSTGAPSGCGMLIFPANHEDDVMAALTTKKFCVLDGVEVEVVRFLSKEEQERVDADVANAGVTDI
jgi:RNA recognition motif-containing protein